MKFSNKLTDAELERLAILAEELGEAQQVVGKIIRHGYASKNPLLKSADSRTNRNALAKEIGDVCCMIEMMTRERDLDQELIDIYRNEKWTSIKRWLHHQKWAK